MKQKVKILSLHMKIGGIEKAICSLANMLCDSYDVEIINVYRLQEKPAFAVDESVAISYLNTLAPNKERFMAALKSRNIIAILKEGIYSIKVLYLRQTKVRKAIKQLDGDIIISSRILFHKYVGKYQKHKLLIAWEHNHHQENQKYQRKLMNSIKRFDYFIPVSKYLSDDYSKLIVGKPICNYLPLCIDQLNEAQANIQSKQLTVVGRLSSEKGYADVLKVVSLVAKQIKDVKLNIVGDGPLKQDLINQSKQLEIEEFVQFHGYQTGDALEKIYLDTAVFLTTSFYESFGLVILEAMNYGIPCVSFDSAKGSLDMIRQGYNGFIIKNRNINEMADKIIELIKHPNDSLSQHAKITVESYSFVNVKRQWISFIKQATELKRSKKKVVFISSAGGHFSELLCLQPLFNRYDSYFITEKNKSMEQYETIFREKIFFLSYGTKEQILKYLYIFPLNIIKSLYLFFSIKPDFIVTTGAHTAVPICYIAKLYRRKVIFIETYANIKTRSLTGRLVYPIADLFFVQWEQMKELYPKAIYKGWLP